MKQKGKANINKLKKIMADNTENNTAENTEINNPPASESVTVQHEQPDNIENIEGATFIDATGENPSAQPGVQNFSEINTPSVQRQAAPEPEPEFEPGQQQAPAPAAAPEPDAPKTKTVSRSFKIDWLAVVSILVVIAGLIYLGIKVSKIKPAVEI